MFKSVYNRYLSSYNGMDESVHGKWRLFDVLKEAVGQTQFIWCRCQMPLFNVSTVEHVESFGELLNSLYNLSYDNFQTSFVCKKDERIDDVLHLLVEHFHFFQHLVFIFLPSEKELARTLPLIQDTNRIVDIRDKVSCVYIYKDIEDDVVWVHNNLTTRA